MEWSILDPGSVCQQFPKMRDGQDALHRRGEFGPELGEDVAEPKGGDQVGDQKAELQAA